MCYRMDSIWQIYNSCAMAGVENDIGLTCIYHRHTYSNTCDIEISTHRDGPAYKAQQSPSFKIK